MISSDYRFEPDLFKRFIHKVFKSYTHKKYFRGHDVGQLCSFKIDEDDYLIINEFLKFDYLGTQDEFSSWKLIPYHQSEINLSDDLTISEINLEIKEIDLIEDDVTTIIDDKAKYHNKETRAIIFKFEDYEIAFEKEDCPFSIEIYIYEGHDLANIINHNPTFATTYNHLDDYNIQLERKLIIIK